MKYMFYNCSSLTSINLDKFSSGKFYVNLSYTFYNCYSIEIIIFNKSSFGVNDLIYTFHNCSKLNYIVLHSFKMHSFSNFDMSHLFYNCQSLKSIQLTNYHFPVSDTREMFYNCIKLTSVTIIPNQASKEINMTKMFYNCKKLGSLTLKIENDNFYFEPNDISFMFYNFKSMRYMLYNYTILSTFNILSNIFENNEVKDMRGIFQNCESIITLNLTTFYTNKDEIM